VKLFLRSLFHRHTRASYVYNGYLAWYNVALYKCLLWYKFVYTHLYGTTPDNCITYTYLRQLSRRRDVGQAQRF